MTGMRQCRVEVKVTGVQHSPGLTLVSSLIIVKPERLVQIC